MKKIALVGLIACSVFVVGCGGDKTPEQVAFEQKKELMAMENAHKREMARIASKSGRNFQQEPSYQQDYQQDYQQEQDYGSSQSQMGSQPQEVRSQNYGVQEQPHAAQVQQQSDEGFGVGSMALAALGGAAAGYLAGEMLNNGMKSYKDDHGNTHYTDKDGRPVSRTAYEDHKKKNPKTTAFKEKASDLKAKTVAGATAVKDKAVATKDKVVNSDRMQQMKTQAVADKEKVQQNQKYQQSKTYTQDTSKAIQGKMDSRIPPKPTVSPSRPVVKPKAYTKRPTTKRR